MYDLVGMKESVEGLQNSLTFGLPEPANEVTTTLGVSEAETTAIINEEAVESQLQELLSDEPCCSKEIESPAQDRNTFKRKRTEHQEKLSTSELIAKEVKVQEDLCFMLKDLSDSIRNHHKEMESSNKRIYRALEKSNDLKAKKLKMMEQHQSTLEQLRIKEVQNKIEKNKKLIELEEIKLKVIYNNN